MGRRKNAIVFASGTKDGGGSGFEGLVRYSREGSAGFRVAAVVSNYAHGGVYERALRLKVPFEHFPGPWTAERCREIVRRHRTPWVLLSGWLKLLRGLDPRRTINIHPGLLSALDGRFGGPGMYGHYVHEAVAKALENNELGSEPRSGFTMHFVIDGDGDPAKAFDKGPIFAEMPVRISKGMTADEIQKTVNESEHMWQSMLTDMVITGKIRLYKGKVMVPVGYDLLPK